MATVQESLQESLPGLSLYSLTFEMERTFKNQFGREWLRQNSHLPIILVPAYIFFVVFLGQRFMHERRCFSLKRLLFAWNLCLAVFSFFGAWRSLNEFSRTIRVNGLHHAICVDEKEDGPHAFWSFAFVVSKLLELGDTVFIVLRKTDLIFLHWYHHITVIIFGWWSSTGDGLSLGRWIMTMNFTVHALMYSYYSLKSIGIRVWKPLAMSITVLQIMQMFIGVFVIGYACITQFVGSVCQTDASSLFIGCLCYTSYLILFLNFFFKSYLGSQRKAKYLLDDREVSTDGQKSQPWKVRVKDSNHNIPKHLKTH